jgi:hypothetical protein
MLASQAGLCYMELVDWLVGWLNIKTRFHNIRFIFSVKFKPFLHGKLSRDTSGVWREKIPPTNEKNVTNPFGIQVF